MASIEEAGRASAEFLRKVLQAKDVRIVKTAKLPDGWEAHAEVYEENSFIKSIGLPTRVMDRNRYRVRMDGELEVQSFERTSE